MPSILISVEWDELDFSPLSHCALYALLIHKCTKREGERTQPGYELNQGINLTRHQLNQGTNSTKERTQPGYELNQSGNKLNQYKI